MTGREARDLWWNAMIGAFILALLASAVAVLHVIDRQRPALARAEQLSYLPKGEYLRLASLGYRQMVADLIWIKVVQHFGNRKETSEGYRWTYHAVDVLTDLDPKFVWAYQATGTILGVWGGHVQESIAILSKGMRHNPEAWELPFYIGYDYYYELRDLAQAAKYFRIASELPGSPEYLPKLAARMTVDAGDPEAALEFLQRLYEQSADERMQEALMQRMREVMAERDLRVLEEAVRRFQVRSGRLPANLHDLVRARLIQRVPREPLGGEYRLEPDGTVTSTGLKERLRVHFHR